MHKAELVRAPATFVVLRHILSHADEGPATMARHCNLHDGSVRAVLGRIRKAGVWHEAEIFRQLQSLNERPPSKRLNFRIQNPANLLRNLVVPHWISGEFAAASEGYDLVPERLLIYVVEPHLTDIVATIKDEFGKLASKSDANLTVALADPWMYLDPNSTLVERGQRLLDYAESRHLQILRGLTLGGTL